MKNYFVKAAGKLFVFLFYSIRSYHIAQKIVNDGEVL